MSTLQALMAWIDNTRQHAPLLDDDADALLARLQALKAQENALDAAQENPACVGLYGHSQAAKAHLLAALCSSGNGRIEIQPGEKILDYFTHINPGHALSKMALRFTRRSETPDDAFPLRLRLLSEAELVQIFIAHAHSQPDLRQVDRSVIEARLFTWKALRQPQNVPGIDAGEVGAIARFWRDRVPASRQQMDDNLWYQFAQLLPSLDLSARASAWSLLWGEQQELTRQWLSLAHTLHQTGNARELAAPLSLLVDNFALPTDGFLTPDIDVEGEVVVHPWAENQLQNAVSIPLATLALLTRELVLPAVDGVLDNVDIIDIPTPAPQDNPPLWQSKCRWLLDGYRQQLQPDVMMICNATASRTETASAAKALLGWVKETQSGQETALPGLVWAITPHDDRFTRKQNLDEAVQQLLGKPGVNWGTLQALDTSSLQRLLEWLSQATTPALRQGRLQALRERHHQQIRALMQHYIAPALEKPAAQKSKAEALVRELQNQAAGHGDLLDGLQPDLRHFDALWQVQQPREEKVSGLFSQSIDLFADGESDVDSPRVQKDTGHLAHSMWVRHLRQWSRRVENAERVHLSPAMLQQLADCLIVTSYRLDLARQLQHVMESDNACAAQLHAAIGNFIAWLGYGDTPVENRPASRIQKGSAIFVAPTVAINTRLSRLGEQPVHAATRYVYDWLVALYTRAAENVGYQNPLDISGAARKQLVALLP